MKNTLIAALAAAPFAFGAAHASDPDEYTLQPIGVGSTTTTIYSPQPAVGGTIITQPKVGSTIITQPVATQQDGDWTNVDINDYIIQDTPTYSQ